MKSNLEFFLCIGISLAVFKRVGKVPLVKERFSEMSLLSIFKILLGYCIVQ